VSSSASVVNRHDKKPFIHYNPLSYSVRIQLSSPDDGFSKGTSR
jgi:hypothetical protein